MGNLRTPRFDPVVKALMVEHLKAAGMPVREKESFVYTRCVFHKGRSLSLWFAGSGRKGGCWKCEEYTTWNDFAQRQGLPIIERLTKDAETEDYSSSYLRAVLNAQDRDDQRQHNVDRVIPRGTTPYTEPWRRLGPKVLARVNARRWWDDDSEYYRILFPVSIDRQIVGFTAGRAEHGQRSFPTMDDVHKRRASIFATLKYRSSKPFPTNDCFYLDDQIGPVPVLVVVEGVYDALRLLQHRIPVLCNFGAVSAWSEQKAEQLITRAGLRYVVLAFDPDDAGDKAEDLARKTLGKDMKVVTASMPWVRKRGRQRKEQVDPGDAPSRWIRSFRQDLIDHTGWNGRVPMRKPLLLPA